MTSVSISLLSITLYFSATGHLAWHIHKGQAVNKSIFFILSIGAIIFHTYSSATTLSSAEGFNFGFYRIGSLFGCLTAFLTLAACLYRPVENLALLSFPVAIVSLIASLSLSTQSAPVQISNEILVHIILSIFAYSVLTVAGGQAILLAMQDYRLKRKQTSGLVKLLPPLQTMEHLLFEMLWAGVFLLSASILSGLIFLDDIFAQHLVHKSILSILAWVVFVGLLIGRYFLGWRGTLAIRWTLVGFLLLMMAYFGSKFVIEVILA
ncbi:MAG: phosphohydrolase [Gammaproteobacteria bacterium]|nr:MAG: phosphohydrolase [Gammaproteobacteria bacterium]PCJ14569.1 MAG: phosphohydrolase [Gammaproteobacteria bacterium]